MDTELKEMMNLLIGRLDKIDQRLNNVEQGVGDLNIRTENIEERTTRTDLQLENVIGPRLQLLYEQNGSFVEKFDKLDALEEKVDEIHTDVFAIKEVVTEDRAEIFKLKQAK